MQIYMSKLFFVAGIACFLVAIGYSCIAVLTYDVGVDTPLLALWPALVALVAGFMCGGLAAQLGKA